MNVRQGGNRNSLDKDTYAEGKALRRLPSISPRDRLEYIAAMLQELKVMSKRANCRALAGLIGKAHGEAARRVRRADRA